MVEDDDDTAVSLAKVEARREAWFRNPYLFVFWEAMNWVFYTICFLILAQCTCGGCVI